MVELEKIKEFFFKAMTQGYAAGGEKIKIPNMPWYKGISFKEGDFYLLDNYCVTPHSFKSAGTTTIWFQGIPVWFMSFGGYYEHQVIQFLKSALSRSYQVQQFLGGRGPKVFSSGSLTYLNQVYSPEFSQFKGREEIFNHNTDKCLGYHEYWGMLLL